MPSRGRGGEQERQKERLETWLKLSKDVRLLRDGNEWIRGSSIDRACKAFGLKGDVAEDRELLLGILADVIFHSPPNLLYEPPRRKRGRPREWINKEVLLQKAILELYPAGTLPASREIAKKVLNSRFAQEFHFPSLDTLAEKIADMRKEKKLSE